VLAIEGSIADQLSLGTDPPAWAARAVLPMVIPNLHAKVKLYEQGSLAVAVWVAGYYASLSSDGRVSGSLVSVPLSLFASVPLARRWLIHPEATYSFARAFGTGDLDDADANGAVATRTGIVGALLQFRVTRAMSLTALGRYQFHSGALVFEGDAAIDEFTTAKVEATLEPRDEHPWQTVAAVAETYDNPSGVIDVARLDAVTQLARARIDELQLDVLAEGLSSALSGLRDRFDASSIPADPDAREDEDRAGIDAVVRLNRTCRGFHAGPSAPDPAANGSLLLTAVVDDSKLARQLWGEFSSCQMSMQRSEARPIDLVADGTLILQLEGPLSATATEAAFLTRFTGELDRPGQLSAHDFDFRVIQGAVEFRIAAGGGGDIIVGIDRGYLTLRGANGTFTCDLATLSCS
jgi:hypothetical protein